MTAGDEVKEEAKPAVAGEVQHVNIKVVAGDGNEISFKIKRSTALSRLMDAYIGKTGVDKNSIKFMFDGVRVNAVDTPDSLGMEDGDQIQTVITQLGGH